MTDYDDELSEEKQMRNQSQFKSTPTNGKSVLHAHNSLKSEKNKIQTPNLHDTLQLSYIRGQSINNKIDPSESQKKIGRNATSQKAIKKGKLKDLKLHTDSSGQLPIIIDNRLYFHYHSNGSPQNNTAIKDQRKSSVQANDQPIEELQDQLPRNYQNLKRSETSQSSLHPIQFYAGSETPKQVLREDQESRMFSRFLKTFNNKNWNEFANRLMENDKHLLKEFKQQVQNGQTMNRTLSRNSLVSQGTPIQSNNFNHFLTTFNSFKNYQWSKLNLEFNQNRAPQTIQKFAKVNRQKQDKMVKEAEERLNTESSMIGGIDQSQPSVSIENTIQSTRIQQQLSLGERKLSEITILQPHQVSMLSPQVQKSKIEHDIRMKKFKMDNEVQQLKSSMNQLNILQSIGSVNILKEFKYPTNMRDIVSYIKEKDLDLYEKIRQTRSLVNARFEVSKDSNKIMKQDDPIKGFIRMFTMSERQQLIVLKEWQHNDYVTNFRLDFMIDKFVRPEDPRKAQRLNNEQLILIFTLSDLKDQVKSIQIINKCIQLQIECNERGILVEKIIALFFDTFKSYDLSFDKIIQAELEIFKERLREQAQQKDTFLRQKEKELDKIIMRQQDTETVLKDKENYINSLLAQRKAQDVRFNVIRNLIDNLIFDYKQKIQKIYGKNKDLRLMARDFIFELKELKRFSEKDDKDFDHDLEQSDEDKLFENLKKKVHKCTQTVTLFAKFEEKQKRKSLDKKAKTHFIRTAESGITANDIQNQEENDVMLMTDERGDHESDQHEFTTVNEEGEHQLQANHDSQQNSKQDINLIDEEENDINSESQTDRRSSQTQTYENNINEDIDSEGNDLIDDHENILNDQEKALAEKEQQYFAIMDDYEPQQILDMIGYYNYMHLKEFDDKQLQTENFRDKKIKILTKSKDESSENGGGATGSHYGNSEPNTAYYRKATITPQNKIKQQFQQNYHQRALSTFKEEEDSLLNDDGESNGMVKISLTNQRNNSIFKGLQLQHQPSNGPPTLSIQVNKQSSSNKFQRQNSQSSGKVPTVESPTKIGSSQQLLIDDILNEVQNLDLNDLDMLLSTDKSYKKKSMQFLQGLVHEIKKTKLFKSLIEKGVKDKMREDEKNQKQKEEKFNSKKGTASTSGTRSNKAGQSATMKKTITKDHNPNISKQNAQGTASPQGTQEIQSVKPRKSQQANQIIEEVSSSSSVEREEPQVKDKGGKKQSDKSKYLKKRGSQNNLNFGRQVKKAVSQARKDDVVRKDDKGIQVDLYNPQSEYDKVKASLHSNSSVYEELKLQTPFINIHNNNSNENSPAHKNVAQIFGKLGAAFRQRIESQILQSNIQMKFSSMMNNYNTSQTVPMPFNLGQKRENKRQLTTHPMAKFLPVFIEKFSQGDRKFLNVSAMSVKQLIKFIVQFHQDKTITSKESRIIKQQFLGEFIYDQLFNKYGIANITEKKLKEILLTIKYNQSKSPMVDLFAKFIGIDTTFYTNDDLSFYYRINRLMVFGDCFQQVIRKEFNFESANIIFQNSYEVFASYFQKKVNQKVFVKIQEELQTKVKPFVIMPPGGPSSGGPILLASEKFFESVIQIYKSLKEQIFDMVKQKCNTLITQEDQYPQCMTERVFDFEEFQRILLQVSSRQQLDVETMQSLFERNRIYLNGQQTQKDEEKRISLEGIISVIFKYDLVTL